MPQSPNQASRMGKSRKGIQCSNTSNVKHVLTNTNVNLPMMFIILQESLFSWFWFYKLDVRASFGCFLFVCMFCMAPLLLSICFVSLMVVNFFLSLF